MFKLLSNHILCALSSTTACPGVTEPTTGMPVICVVVVSDALYVEAVSDSFR
jgi:hypothetical protein